MEEQSKWDSPVLGQMTQLLSLRNHSLSISLPLFLSQDYIKDDDGDSDKKATKSHLLEIILKVCV